MRALTFSEDVAKSRIGTNADGNRIIVTVELRQDRGDFTSATDHTTLTDLIEASFTFEEFNPRKRRSDGIESAGAGVFNAIHSITKLDAAWTQDDADKLATLAELWHLNTMSAACDHQTVIYEDGPYGRRPSLELTEPCEQSGYRYGSSWLAREVPEDVLGWLRDHLMFTTKQVDWSR